MSDEENAVAYVLLSDPEGLPSFTSPTSSNRPVSEQRILRGDDLRAQILVDTEKLNTYFQSHAQSNPSPFDEIWMHVRSGDEDALQEFPFLLTAGRFKHLIDAGEITFQSLEDVSPEPGRWLTGDASGNPPKDVVSLAHRWGPVFSLARFIHETQDIPEAGTKWHVYVYLMEEDEAGATKTWHEYSCEVTLSDGLIAQAAEAARRYVEDPHPLGWITKWKNISLIVGDREEDRKGFRTDESDIKGLCLVLQEMYDCLPETPAGAGILQYFIGWNVHLPTGKAKTFYHGLCHGFRISHDVAQLLMQIHSDSREVFLLEQLFEYLSAKAAETFSEEQIEIPTVSPFENVRPLPRNITKRTVLPFQLQRQDIEILAGQVDKSLLAKLGPLYTRPSRRPGESPSAPLLESGYSTTFYEGVIHALSLSERVMAIYEKNILPRRVTGALAMAEGSHQSCCIAARHWVQALYGSVN